MRVVILFLVFVNLAFFYWAREHSFNEVLPERLKSVTSHKPIKLLSEVKQESLKLQSELSADAVQTPLDTEIQQNIQIQKCFSLGPFETTVVSDEVYESLLGAGIQVKQRIVNERQPKSYWVYLPSYNSLKEAEATVDFLKKNNVREFYIRLESPQKHAVSLGSFTKLSVARNKVDQVRELDLTPKMEVSFNEFTQYWVDFNYNRDVPQPQVLEETLRNNDRMLILETKCL